MYVVELEHSSCTMPEVGTADDDEEELLDWFLEPDVGLGVD